MNKSDRIALLSLLLNILKVCAGPLTLYFISIKLSTELIGFYYAFFGVVGLKMLFEAGMANVIKVNYSHRMNDSKAQQHLFIFSFYWYLLISILLMVSLIFIGNEYFSAYNGAIKWRYPWYLLCISSSLGIFLTFIETYLDGIQKQIELKILQIISNLSIFVLWIALLMDFELYSLGLMQISSALITILFLAKKSTRYINLKALIKIKFSFKKEFLTLYPLLKKVFCVWIISYLFWNGYNLLAFKVTTPELAGKIGLTFNLALSGYTIANSIISNQMTHISFLVSQKKFPESQHILYKYLFISTIILIIGYSAYIIIYYLIPDIFFFKKVLDIKNTIYLFLFFIIINIFSSFNNYVRTFKVEPFILLSIYNTISVMTLYYIELKAGDNYFKSPLFAILFTLVYSMIYYRIFINKYKG
ncbi:hypothetical protein EKQ45_03550 [Proteus vulgaris]|uniref:hypothetical protein n=1 Tax=Proteus mirabilis TaxID=584 RepID=UPI001374283D|nr:hypothetical protein [Proteus mirabilis]MDC5973693.1 hypothetical protein [Proteus mirabilis]QHP75098.1 hypothetical protein EKQ45_03550 [Proteus vulgaris]